MKYATAICKKCFKAIYNSEGVVDKNGFWVCVKCDTLAKEAENIKNKTKGE